MKKIEVPLIFQKPKSDDCGPVCVQMVLGHFNMNVELDDLKQNMLYLPGGTYIYDNGIGLLQRGLKVELITANPLIFKKEDVVSLDSNKKVIAHLSKFEKMRPNKKDAITLFKKYLKVGGEVTLEIPVMKHITFAIDKHKLVIALLYGGALGKNEGGFHYVIVNGYKKGFVHINNPGKKSRQGWFPEEDFIFALHSSSGFDIDNGSLLIAGK